MTSSASEGVPGRPSAVCELVVTIDSKENVMQSDSYANSMLLWVPNRLLFGWYQNYTITCKYVSLVNDVILDKVVQLKPKSDDLAQKLHQRA